MSPSRYAGLMYMPLVACMGAAQDGAATPAADPAASHADGAPAQSTRVPPLPPGMRAPPGTGGIMAPPGDADEAIRSEFRTVERRGTREAYLVFAQRHPDHPLAQEAAKRADALAKRPPE